jgi:predicted phage gp36 major capsid-like protein
MLKSSLVASRRLSGQRYCYTKKDLKTAPKCQYYATGAPIWSSILSPKADSANAPSAKLHLIDPRILVIEDFLNEKECIKLIAASEALGFEEAKIDPRSKRENAYSQALSSSLVRKDIRNNFRYSQIQFYASLTLKSNYLFW